MVDILIVLGCVDGGLVLSFRCVDGLVDQRHFFGEADCLPLAASLMHLCM